MVSISVKPGTAATTVGIAVLGFLTGRQVPPAPPAAERIAFNWNVIGASVQLVSGTMHIRRLFLAILAISFFWTIGAVLIIIFPPLVKNVLGANEQVASLFIGIFSVGIAIGSVLINRLLKSEVSARFAPASVIAMGVFVLMLHFVALAWGKHDPGVTTLDNFLLHPMAGLMIVALLGVAITGGMFVVPLYAILQTATPRGERSRVIAANNIVNAAVTVVLVAAITRLAARHVSVPGLIGRLGLALENQGCANQYRCHGRSCSTDTRLRPPMPDYESRPSACIANTAAI